MTDQNEVDRRSVDKPGCDPGQRWEIPKGMLNPRAGDLCPECKEGRLDYDGLLNLVCPVCGFSLAGCFT